MSIATYICLPPFPNDKTSLLEIDHGNPSCRPFVVADLLLRPKWSGLKSSAITLEHSSFGPVRLHL